MKNFIFAVFLIFSVNSLGDVKKGKSVIYPVKHISISILRPVADVYNFASDPFNLPKWASGLSSANLVKTGDDWTTDSPMGKIQFHFTEKNKFGVLDHDVTVPSGDVVHNPLRVMKNGNGSEVVFTLFRLPNVSDADFNKDATTIERDLKKLKSLLEK